MTSSLESQHEYDKTFNVTAKYWRFLQEKLGLSILSYFQHVHILSLFVFVFVLYTSLLSSVAK
jgi:hypothetical protein